VDRPAGEVNSRLKECSWNGQCLRCRRWDEYKIGASAGLVSCCTKQVEVIELEK
jgi:hypothetical protein